MSEQIVSALAKMKELYVEQVRDNDPQQRVLEEKMQQVTDYKKAKRWWDDDGDGIGWEPGEVDGKFMKKRKKKLKESEETDNQVLADIRQWKNSGAHNSDESADNVEKVMRAIKPSVNENVFYSWRDSVDESLLHEINDISDNEVVKEKNVNNYVKDGKKEPVVVINPEMKTESVLLDSEELGEDFIEEAIDIATEYLCEEGLSDQDVEDLINELGVEEFSEWVMQFGYETLLEERAAKRAKPKKSVEEIKAEIDAREKAAAAKKAAVKKPTATTPKSSTSVTKSSRPPGQERLIRGARSVAQSATSPENIRSTVKGALDTVARGALSAAKGHQRAMEIKKKGGTLAQQLGGGAGAALGSFFKRGTAQFKEWVDNLLEEGYDLSEYTWDELYEEYELQEKAVSEQQQKLFGLALSVKRGETSRDKVSPEVLKIVNTMSEAEIRKYASTPHEDVPEKKKELAEKVIQFVRESR
jgi:hypothetical protein